jgi:hypothetical protein
MCMGHSEHTRRQLGNTHYHEGLLLRVVCCGVLPQTSPLLFLRQLPPLSCPWQSVSRGQHCICSPITISTAITHVQRGCMWTAPPWPTDARAPTTITPLRSSLFWYVVWLGWQSVKCPRRARMSKLTTLLLSVVQCSVYCATVPAVCTSVLCTTSTQLLHIFFVLQLTVSKCIFRTLPFSMPLTASKNWFLHWPCTQCIMCVCSIITLIQHMLYVHYTGLEIHYYIYLCLLQLLVFVPTRKLIYLPCCYYWF